MGVAVSITSGVLLSPYLINKLGDQGYGVWVLVFGLIENYWILDLGLRSATVKYSAHYRAMGQPEKVNEVLNTGILYFSALAFALLFATAYLARNIERFFQVPPAYRDALSFLVMVVGASWAIGMIFNVFNACLEGFQDFGVSSRIWIAVTTLRVAGIFLLLHLGYGLMGLGVYVVCCQVFGYVLSYFAVRKVFPAQRFSPRFATWPMFRQLAGYGFHTLTSGVARQLLSQSAPLIIGHFHMPSFIGYYNVPVRLLQYTADAVDRVGLVTASNAAELTARHDTKAISRLGVYINRYCLTLFLPPAIFLAVYGAELMRVWIRRPEYVLHSAPLLPILVLGTTLGMAAQFNSSSILYGMAKHRWFARGVLAEGLLLIASLWYVVPRYGILGAAWVSSLLMVADRGLFTPWLVCRYLRQGYGRYMRSIYARPLATAAPVAALAYWLKTGGAIPGDNLIEVAAAAAVIAAVYYGIAFYTAIERNHRALVAGWLSRRLTPRAAVRPRPQE
ncbi:MAG TPA: oligosaccharide flippase family protein [Bryobacteraceae bacterium]|nr:oligosaccharide flippase family protein [Bryobacteraceae bacterium]